uniref:Uncharacterized protein n=1 Tax=Arundo donax TaxID=35708 RepID=A0A0A9BUK5_ARUDO
MNIYQNGFGVQDLARPTYLTIGSLFEDW